MSQIRTNHGWKTSEQMAAEHEAACAILATGERALSKSITWKDTLNSETSLTIGPVPESQSAGIADKAWNAAYRMGYTKPRWWQWWRWDEQRPPKQFTPNPPASDE